MVMKTMWKIKVTKKMNTMEVQNTFSGRNLHHVEQPSSITSSAVVDEQLATIVIVFGCLVLTMFCILCYKAVKQIDKSNQRKVNYFQTTSKETSETSSFEFHGQMTKI